MHGETADDAVTEPDDAVRQPGYAPTHLAATRAVAATAPGHGTRAASGIRVTGHDQPTLTRLAQASAIVGAVFYLLWGLLHIQAGVTIASLGLGLHKSTMVQGRIYQDSFYTFSAAAALIITVMVSAWKVSDWKGWKCCYWLTLGIAAATVVSFIIFILVPGYMKLWPGLEGPGAWGIAWSFWTWSYVLRSRIARAPRRTGEGRSEARPVAQ